MLTTSEMNLCERVEGLFGAMTDKQLNNPPPRVYAVVVQTTPRP